MTQATATRVKSVKTPGAIEPSQPTQPTEEQRQQMANEADALEASLLAGGDTELSIDDKAPGIAPDLQAFIAAEIQKGIAAGLAAQRKATANPAGPSAPELPDQSEIDAFSIKTEVLTKQGYVVPHAYPQPAGLPQALR